MSSPRAGNPRVGVSASCPTVTGQVEVVMTTEPSVALLVVGTDICRRTPVGPIHTSRPNVEHSVRYDTAAIQYDTRMFNVR